jgi:ADP-ribose pyrophosphatase YjhB (NUDIX family)
MSVTVDCPPGPPPTGTCTGVSQVPAVSLGALCRHVDGLLAALAADHGRVDTVCRRDDRDRLLDAFERFGVVGGAGVRVRDERGRLLLARYPDAGGWVDPGDGRRPGESYAECARRGVAETAAVEATVTGLAQVQVLYMDDWTDRPPVPNPFVSFTGRCREGRARPGDGVADVRWFDHPPDADELVYAELGELAVPDRT